MNIIVIGAGIGGLSAAIALSQKGHHVRVFERSQGLSEFGAGIQIAPNAVRLLYAWGLQKEFEKLVFEPRISVARRYSSGKVIGRTCQNPASGVDYGFPYWQIYRPDFQRLLADGAVKAGARIEYDVTVADVDVENGSLTLRDNTTVTADFVVCADGIRSYCRNLIIPHNDVDPIPFNEHNYRAMIPRAEMMSDLETAEMITSNNTQAFLGPGRAIICYPISAGQLFNLAIISHPDVDGKEAGDSTPIGRWNEPADLEDFRNLFKDFCPSVRKLTGLVKDCTRWKIAEVPDLKSWSSQSGKTVLLGDSAHAMSPHAAQGSAMAIEDAGVLAECLAYFAGNVAGAADAYQSIRKPRVRRIAQIARSNGGIFVLPDGPEQEARDRNFRAVTVEEQNISSLELEMRTNTRVSADQGAKWPSPELMMWINGFDAVSEANRFLREAHEVGSIS